MSMDVFIHTYCICGLYAIGVRVHCTYALSLPITLNFTCVSYFALSLSLFLSLSLTHTHELRTYYTQQCLDKQTREIRACIHGDDDDVRLSVHSQIVQSIKSNPRHNLSNQSHHLCKGGVGGQACWLKMFVWKDIGRIIYTHTHTHTHTHTQTL